LTDYAFKSLFHRVYITNKERGFFICKDKNEAITEIKKILANATLNDAARAMIPAECGGTGPNSTSETKPPLITTVDDWAKTDVEDLWKLCIATDTQYTDITQPITRKQFASVAVEVYHCIIVRKQALVTMLRLYNDVK